jgi:alpha-1,6-mannosyltransferase
MAFLAVAVLTAVLYAAWVLWVPLLPDNLYVPLLDLGKITGYTWRSALLFLGLILSLYGLYALGYRLVRRGKAGLIVIFAMGAFFCVELLWAYPATAVDVFGYVAHGRLFALHHLNPFISAPDEFPGDPIIQYLAFPDEPSQYGPVWVLVGGLLSTLAGGNLLTEVLLYKGVAALAHLAGAGVVYKVAAALTADGDRARASAYLYLWNPMLLWEMVGNAHNDGFMMLFGLIAAWLFVRGVDLLVLPAVALGALVKIPVALIAPALFIGVWKSGRARAVEGALLALALAAVVYRPFWEGIATLTALRRTELFTASLGSVLRLSLIQILGLSDASATSIARSISFAAFSAVCVLALWLAIRAERRHEILSSAYLTLLGGLLLATTWFQAWYVVWPLALGAMLAEPRRHLEVALLSLGGLLQYFVFIYLWVMGLFPMGENLAVQSAAYLCIVGPLLVGALLHSVLVRGESTWTRNLHHASG